MPARYTFDASWEVPAPVDEVAQTIVDLEHYPAWWPQVRAVAKLSDDAAWVRCRATLPYTLDLVLDAVSRTAPVLEVAISGDLDGFARFAVASVAGGTRLEFRQEVDARGLVGLASYCLRPVLEWNHHRMMDGCRDGLARRLSAGRPALLLHEPRP